MTTTHQPGGLKTIGVCGAGHSGSTLLGMVLGSHSQAFYMGEGAKVRYLHDEAKPLRKRVCKICGETCPVWSKFHWDRERALHAQLAGFTGADVIVDTTKDERWIASRAEETRAAGGTPYLIFLTRDGRAVVNSRIRKYPERDPGDQIRQWAEKMSTSRALFEAFEGPKREVRYEDLASNTEATVRGLCAWLEIDFEPAMLDFTTTPHHVLGGNNGTQYLAAKAVFGDPDAAFVSLTERTRSYYGEHSGGIELDLRWKSELSAEHAALFETLAGDINAKIKWEAA